MLLLSRHSVLGHVVKIEVYCKYKLDTGKYIDKDGSKINVGLQYTTLSPLASNI